MIKLSVVIITFNEEKNISRAISSVRDVADEIIIVDSFSTDKTEAICLSWAEKLGLNIPLRFSKQPFLGYIEQKNFAFSLAHHDYILSLDADEALSKELRDSIIKIKSNFLVDGYKFNRLTNYNGDWIHHCGWYPDTKLRLVKKEFAFWDGVNPHDFLTFKKYYANIEHIPGDLLHYSYESISSHVLQTNKFTTIAARASFDRGKKSHLGKIIFRPILKFFRDYFIKRGFLDGRYGLVICIINGFSEFLKYSKILDLQKNKQI